MITFAYDRTINRVGCAIVQRAMGANIDNFALGFFNNWIEHPTPDMQLYQVKDEDELASAIVHNNKINAQIDKITNA